MKFLLLIIPAMALVSCASMQTATVADYNGDGAISNAEYVQFQKQKDIEDRNVYSESVKRRNVTNTARDATEGLAHVRMGKYLWDSF